MPKPRSPVLGFNHNLRHKGWLFHVQTEDSGVQNPHIFTHLFHDGVILQSKKCEYDAESDVDIVKGLMQAQHKSVMKELKNGTHDIKIERYLGVAPPGGQKPLPKVPSPGDFATDAGSLPYDAFEVSDAVTPPPEEPAISISRMRPDETEPVDMTATMERKRIPSTEEDDLDVSGVFRMLAMPPVDTTRDERPPVPSRPEPRSIAPAGILPETMPPPMPGYTPGQKRTGQVPVTPPARPGNTGAVARPATVPPGRPGQTAARPLTPVQGVAARPGQTGAVPRPGPTGGQVVRPQPPPIPAGAKAASPRSPVSAAGVVVNRPAVVVGAPPRVIGSGDSGPVVTPAAPVRRTAVAAGREFTPPPPTDNIFGQDLISEKSLDEVIMAYLSEDAEEEP